MAGDDLLNPSPTGTHEPGRDRRIFGGQPRDIVGVDQNGRYIWGEGSVERETKRYQSMGEAAAQRGAYQNNWAQSSESREGQQDAAALMRNAAYGNAPSAAQIAGRNMLDQSLNNAMAIGASARGGSLAQAAAMRNAQTQAGATQMQGANQIAALRAQEMAQARGDYFGAQAGMRGQDLQQQGMDMQSNLAQRQLNQQAEQWFEGRRYDVLAGEQQAGLQQQAIESNQAQFAAQLEQRKRERTEDMWIAGAGAAGSAGSAVIDAYGTGNHKSDIRAKESVTPVSGDGIVRENPYSLGEVAGLQHADITRADPYAPAPAFATGAAMRKPSGFGHGMSLARGSADFGSVVGHMVSDARAKREAFEEGARYADAQHAGVDLKAPAYAVTQPAPAAQAAPPQSTLDKVRQSEVVKGVARGGLGAIGGPLLGGAAAGWDSGKRYVAERGKAQAAEDPMASANRAMEGSSYAYKSEFTPPEQAPGERNVGPMAQNMAADPVASTAVKKDPKTGMLVLDGAKTTKLNSAGIASLQKQVDGLAAAVAKKKGGK